MIFLIVFKLSTFLSYGQEGKKVEAQENLIDLPSWLTDSERETIREIEAQDIIDWSDYIQLAISYTQLNADGAKIEKLIKSSLEKNTSDSCKLLNFILKNRKSWNLTYKYGQIVSKQLKSYECNNQ